MNFTDEYDPWCLFGTSDPLLDDAAHALTEEEMQQYAEEWETWEKAND